MWFGIRAEDLELEPFAPRGLHVALAGRGRLEASFAAVGELDGVGVCLGF